MKQTEATERYYEASKSAFEKIDEITMMLYKHGRKFDGANWGYVGDMNFINTQLTEIINQLKTVQ